MKKKMMQIVSVVGALCPMLSYAATNINTTVMDGVVESATAWVSWGVTAIGGILVVGLGIFMARWAYRKIVKGGISAS